MDGDWDCIVVGGGAAGLSAALVLGRARRSTLLVDAGQQSNLPAHGIGGLLGQDGKPPSGLYALAERELASYPAVELRRGSVLGGERLEPDGFLLELDDGSSERAQRVLLASGMEYRPPSLPGIAERWGHSVFHCPFCHGWEVREQPLAVLDRGADGSRRALLLGAWSDQVTLLASGPAELGNEDARQLAAAGVVVDEREVAGLRGPGDELEAVVFADGSELPCAGVLVPVTLHQHSSLAAQLGVELAPPSPLSAEAIATDGALQTSVPGVFAAGDLRGEMPSVANSIAAGSKAAAVIVHGLMEDRAAAPAR
jgi:thioredoxin reductase